MNAFLALFYHLATAAIRNFIPHPKGFLANAFEHMTYQARGIFYGESHPRNAAGQKLNPLQQVTYLALLNVLFPLQIVTGALIWAVGKWPAVANAVRRAPLRRAHPQPGRVAVPHLLRPARLPGLHGPHAHGPPEVDDHRLPARRADASEPEGAER